MKRRQLSAMVLAAVLLTVSAGCASDQGQPPSTSVSGIAPTEDADSSAKDTIPEILPAAQPDIDISQDPAVDEVQEAVMKDLYSDAFRIGVAVQAIDHWNDPTAEIGNPDKEELICREFNSMTFGNEWKPAYNFDASSPTLYKTDRAAEELLTWAETILKPTAELAYKGEGEFKAGLFPAAPDAGFQPDKFGCQCTHTFLVSAAYRRVLDSDHFSSLPLRKSQARRI